MYEISMRCLYLILMLLVNLSINLDCFIFIDEFTFHSYIDTLYKKFKSCNYTMKYITILNSQLKNLDFLKPLKRIDADEGTVAVLIQNNNLLKWNDNDLFQLKTINTNESMQHRKRLIISIEDNDIACIPERVKNRLIIAAGGLEAKKYIRIQLCTCVTKLVKQIDTDGTVKEGTDVRAIDSRCEIMKGDLILHKLNTKTWTQLGNKLKTLREIYGRIEISETSLKNLSFFENLRIVRNAGPNVHNFSSDYLNASIVVQGNKNLSSFQIKTLEKIEKNPSLRYYISVYDNQGLTFKDNEYKFIVSYSPDIYYPLEECKFNKKNHTDEVVITSHTVDILGNCTTLSGRMIIFDERSPDEERLMKTKWEIFEGCVIINNTSLKTLNFLKTLQSIRCIDEHPLVPALNIRNNSELESITIDASVYKRGFNETNKVKGIEIANNDQLCEIHAITLEDQLRSKIYKSDMVTDVHFVGTAKNSTCDHKFAKRGDTIIYFFMLMILCISIILIGLLYIFNVT